jgi:cytochrome c-type biogenesis protein CcmF
VGPLTRWKRQELAPLVKQLRLALLASILLGGLMLAMVADSQPVMVGVALALACWVLFACLIELRRKLANKDSLWSGLRSLRSSYYGMLVAHCGIAVTMVGIACTSYFSVEKDVRLAPGEVLEVAGYGFSFHGVQDIQGPNYIARRGEVRVERNGQQVALLHPEKRVYQVQRNPMTEAGIDAGLFRDLYVALGEPLNDGAWSVRVYVKPFVRWIWLGGLIMAFGGFLAVIDRRYRMAVPATRSAPFGGKLAVQGEG